MTNPTRRFKTDTYPYLDIYLSEDVAAALGISVVQARRLMKSGKIPAVKLPDYWLTTRKQVQEYLKG